ncbi:MAG: HNH endonuclease [Acidobacteriota bacterium]|nr:HNH endonuclease [Acidobacteriota bacterium]
MSVSIKQTVRERANFACEYCGVSEQNAGGELTIDHFRPQSKDGGDGLENLVYACVRCNLYKSDYWVEPPDNLNLWNPCFEPAEIHFWQADDGHLYALTEKGTLSIRILNLNRPQLIAYRQNQRMLAEERQMLEESEINAEILFRLGEEQREIIRKQQILLEEQRQLLKLLLKKY